MLAEDKSIVFEFWLCRGAFVGPQRNSIALIFVDHTQGLKMVFQGLGVDQNVVDVCLRELAHVLENVVHGLLKCRSGVAQYERLDLVRKCAVLCTERCAFAMFGKYTNLMKA